MISRRTYNIADVKIHELLVGGLSRLLTTRYVTHFAFIFTHLLVRRIHIVGVTYERVGASREVLHTLAEERGPSSPLLTGAQRAKIKITFVPLSLSFRHR